MTTQIPRPILTMPAAEAEHLRQSYGAAEVILEYGSGGSTVFAAEQAGKTIFAVESDKKWLAMLQGYFADHPPLATVHLHHGDIGPTRSWGYPKTSETFLNWPRYPITIWDLPDFVHPDLVLIDGRFRPACFLTTLFRIKRPVTVLWDDYIDRPEYFLVEDFAKPVSLTGRMARFEIAPMSIPPERLLGIVQSFLRAK